jgi:23S rRNA (adenine2503-C2)-methyltransferase
MPPTDAATKLNLAGISPRDLARFVASAGWPRHRTSQILRWIYRKRIDSIDEMTDLSQAHRAALAERAYIERVQLAETRTSEDGTEKLLARLHDGLLIESVLIPDGARLTLCLSTQVGCTLDCGFCLTGTMGLRRNLDAGEIVGQLLLAQSHLGPAGRITNLVFMGMGEPLANLTALQDAIARITNTVWGPGIPARRITVSTAGLASRLADAAESGVNLAVSLNATTEAQRRRLMPAAARLHTMTDLLAACRALPLGPRRRLTFEYVLLAGENDREEDARRLAALIKNLRCKVNLIAFNAFPGNPYRRPADAAVERFQAILRNAGLDVFLRKSKGRDVLGACGQLGRLAESAAPLLSVGAST